MLFPFNCDTRDDPFEITWFQWFREQIAYYPNNDVKGEVEQLDIKSFLMTERPAPSNVEVAIVEQGHPGTLITNRYVGREKSSSASIDVNVVDVNQRGNFLGRCPERSYPLISPSPISVAQLVMTYQLTK
jgi:hypothetical protein